MLKRASVALCVLAFFSTLPAANAADDLYGSKGIVPEAVRQGKLGSCYFHAVIAALAERRGDTIRKMIHSNPDGSYTVTFGDGKKEIAYPEDLRYTHDSGYDLSDGEWVAVLFRAYAQRVLRESLLQDIDSSDIFPLLKTARRRTGGIERSAGAGLRPRHPRASGPIREHRPRQAGRRASKKKWLPLRRYRIP